MVLKAAFTSVRPTRRQQHSSVVIGLHEYGSCWLHHARKVAVPSTSTLPVVHLLAAGASAAVALARGLCTPLYEGR